MPSTPSLFYSHWPLGGKPTAITHISPAGPITFHLSMFIDQQCRYMPRSAIAAYLKCYIAASHLSIPMMLHLHAIAHTQPRSATSFKCPWRCYDMMARPPGKPIAMYKRGNISDLVSFYFSISLNWLSFVTRASKNMFVVWYSQKSVYHFPKMCC